ncbi:DUF881 domain-containing protein [Jiangella gansuensis]|uniref:DUF881 domain-containing protein n=1 Tax=Jiangella gansuensis TaxID=281473 RepID=UPI0004B9B324|nr:DUF881 domain-containing protein [Jiangella gansuensis]
MPDRDDDLDDARGAPDRDGARDDASRPDEPDAAAEGARDAAEGARDDVEGARDDAEGTPDGDGDQSPVGDDLTAVGDDGDRTAYDEPAVGGGGDHPERAGDQPQRADDHPSGDAEAESAPAAGDRTTAPRRPFVAARPRGHGGQRAGHGGHTRSHAKSTSPGAGQSGSARFTPAAPSGPRRLWKAITQRPDLGHVGVALLVALLGFGAVVQVRADDDDTLANARRDDLVQILDGLRRQADRLDDHVADLEADRRELVSGANTEAEALQLAQERARTVGVLAGTVPATGSGIIMTVTDPDRRVSATLMLQAINELRVAGAEAIQIRGGGNDTAVRVIASTAFENPEAGVLEVGGVRMEPPYEIVAIGDPRELSGAMTFAEGIVSRIESQDAAATVTEYDELTVDVLHEPQPPEYAHPAPDDEDDE